MLVGLASGACAVEPEVRNAADSAATPRAGAVASVPATTATTANSVVHGEAVSSAPAQSSGKAAVPGAPALRRSDSSATHGRAAPAAERAPARQPAGPRKVLLGDFDLTGIGYDRGSATAPVVMIDLSDFSCPYCGAFSLQTYPAIEREYVKTGKVFFKYVPFVVGSFPHSREVTRATECAAEQGGFWPMMTRVYESQREWRKGGDPFPLLSGLASSAGLDTARLRECYLSGRTDARTARASNLANALGVRVTPSFIINERPVQGALPLADFRKVIDAALLLSRVPK